MLFLEQLFPRIHPSEAHFIVHKHGPRGQCCLRKPIALKRGKTACNRLRAQGWSPEDLPSDEPDADPHGVTPSAKPAALTLSRFGVLLQLPGSVPRAAACEFGLVHLLGQLLMHQRQKT